MNEPTFPFREPIAGKWLVTDRWRIWLRDLFLATTEQTSKRIASVTIPSGAGAIATTPFPTGSLAGGLYRVSVFAHIVVAATISSSLIITISFTHHGVACALQTDDLNGNLTTSVRSATFPIQIDAGTPISYRATYASSAAGMQYALAAAVETVNAV